MAVGQKQLRGIGGDSPQIVGDEQQDRVAALAAVEHLKGLVAALRLVPPDAVHRHGGVGVTGHHAEQASAVAHHPLLRDIPNKGILGAQSRRLIVDPVPQRDRQITQAAVDIADIGHREALVLLPFIQLLPQQVQRVVVGSRLAAVHTVTVRIASVRHIPAGRRIPVVDVDRPHAGYLHLTGSQGQRHGQGQQRRCKKPDQFLPIVAHGSPPSCVLLSLIPVRG